MSRVQINYFGNIKMNENILLLMTSFISNWWGFDVYIIVLLVKNIQKR
jgi:hypothetical protein